MKILDSYWFTNVGIIGVILVENDAGEQTARIAALEISTTQDADCTLIARNGARLSYGMAKGFFPYIQKKKYKKT